MPAPPAEPPPRLLESMPRPLLVLFGIGVVAALVISVVFIVRPPSFGTVALQDRRPPPSGVYSHDPVDVFPAPTPTVAIPYEAPCERFATVDPVGGLAFTRRVTDALDALCTLQGPSVAPELADAVRGLRDVRVRIAEFGRSGIEGTLDYSTRTIWVNLKLTGRRSGFEELIPVLVHDGYHLGRADEEVTAAEELGARRAELAACRAFIRVADWPRWCEDARDLSALPQAQAIELLVSAGFPRQVSSGA